MTSLDRSERGRADSGSSRRAQVAGSWRSELGSDLSLVEGPEGVLHGTYRSAVGQTCGSQPLTGVCVRRADGTASVGFVVGWPRTDSLAAWTGRYDPADERIVAEWLLESGSIDATTWRATHLGRDIFHRFPAQAQEGAPMGPVEGV